MNTSNEQAVITRALALSLWKSDGWLEDDFDKKGLTYRLQAGAFLRGLDRAGYNVIPKEDRDD